MKLQINKFLLEEEKENKVMHHRLINYSLVFLFFLFLVLPTVSSAPPGEIFESDIAQGLTFAPSTFSTLKEGAMHKIHVHVINRTDVQTNATTSCFVHLYNSSGSHILESPLSWDSNSLEFKLDVEGGYQTVGQYAYILQCNNTGKEIHLVKGGYEVTPSGTQPNIGFYILFLSLSLGIVILGYATKDHATVVLGSFGLYFVGIYILFFGINGVRDTTYTWAIGIIILMLAAYLSTRASYELIVD